MDKLIVDPATLERLATLDHGVQIWKMSLE